MVAVFPEIPKLLNWYHKFGRALPWRGVTDPYAVWISEVMLQQTTVATVIQRYGKFLEQFPDIENLANAPFSEVQRAFQGLGYYRRVVNLHEAAKILYNAGSVFPKDPEALQKLPGFGPYMSASVASFAFNFPVIAADVNLHRIACRLNAQNFSLDQTKSYFEKWLKHVDSSHLNQLLMDFGSLVCSKRKPLCHHCPLQESCLAFKKNAVSEFPKTTTKPAIIPSVSLRFLDDQKTIVKRPAVGWYKDMWDFPYAEIIGEDLDHLEIFSLIKSITHESFEVVSHLRHPITHHKISAFFIRTKKTPKILRDFFKNTDRLKDQSILPSPAERLLHLSRNSEKQKTL